MAALTSGNLTHFLFSEKIEEYITQAEKSPRGLFCGIMRVTCRMFSDPNRMSGRGASSSSVRQESLGRRRTRKHHLLGNGRPLVATVLWNWLSFRLSFFIHKFAEKIQKDTIKCVFVKPESRQQGGKMWQKTPPRSEWVFLQRSHNE